jgi:uncharacterized protein
MTGATDTSATATGTTTALPPTTGASMTTAQTLSSPSVSTSISTAPQQSTSVGTTSTAAGTSSSVESGTTTESTTSQTSTSAPPSTSATDTTSTEMTSTVPQETTEPLPPGAFDARTGSFKMLVLSLTEGHRHGDSIVAGKRMLSEMATEQGFETKFTETMEEFTVEGLSEYEIVFFLATSGNFFSEAQKQNFQEWMTQHDGAYAGIHSATDTENGWNFYSEVTGQYYDGHTMSPDAPGEVQWDPAQIGHVAVQGMPSPWTRQEEWYKFNQSAQWSMKPGFVILGRVAINDDGGTRPVSYTREWSNFRSFYTSMGHAGTTVSDPNFKKHVTGGVMWAVRREASIQ